MPNTRCIHPCCFSVGIAPGSEEDSRKPIDLPLRRRGKVTSSHCGYCDVIRFKRTVREEVGHILSTTALVAIGC
jgi:hypothetical protein